MWQLAGKYITIGRDNFSRSSLQLLSSYATECWRTRSRKRSRPPQETIKDQHLHLPINQTQPWLEPSCDSQLLPLLEVFKVQVPSCSPCCHVQNSNHLVLNVFWLFSKSTWLWTESRKKPQIDAKHVVNSILGLNFSFGDKYLTARTESFTSISKDRM